MDTPQELAQPDIDLFRIHSRGEIINILRNLQDKKQMLRMMIRGGAHSTVTSILDVDKDSESVVLDVSPDAVLNQRFLDASPLRFEAVLDHISISFESDSIRECQHEDRPAFLINLPSSLIRLQRREFYRVETPRLKPVQCAIQIPEDSSRSKILLRLENVSGGGVALVDENHDLDATIGKIYDDCRIELPNKTFLVVKLQIRNTREIALHDGRKVRRVGCQFMDMPRAMLTAVQRYITQLEREQNARRALFD